MDANGGPSTLRYKMKRNGDSWGLYLGKWALGMLATILAIVMVSGARSSIKAEKDIAIIQSEQQHLLGDMTEVKADLKGLDTKIDAHILRSGAGGGGGGR